MVISYFATKIQNSFDFFGAFKEKDYLCSTNFSKSQ